jgi:hypothetical protein
MQAGIDTVFIYFELVPQYSKSGRIGSTVYFLYFASDRVSRLRETELPATSENGLQAELGEAQPASQPAPFPARSRREESPRERRLAPRGGNGADRGELRINRVFLYF